jgi:hypothetical protein
MRTAAKHPVTEDAKGVKIIPDNTLENKVQRESRGIGLAGINSNSPGSNRYFDAGNVGNEDSIPYPKIHKSDNKKGGNSSR